MRPIKKEKYGQTVGGMTSRVLKPEKGEEEDHNEERRSSRQYKHVPAPAVRQKERVLLRRGLKVIR